MGRQLGVKPIELSGDAEVKFY